MTKKMLIDASHPEETRVVVVDRSRIEELDFESRAKRQLRGNVYLARVTRVEPSLQAAFVEFGGNRHGFLAFSEIHPDYYQIPFADRQKLIEEEEEVLVEDDDEDEEDTSVADAQDDSDDDEDDDFDPLTPAATTFRTAENRKVKDLDDPTAGASRNYKAAELEFEEDQARKKAKAERAKASKTKKPAKITSDDSDDDDDDDDAADEDDKEVALEQKKNDQKRKQRLSRRRYKIQEVIKRGQIMLVQAVKEERGNKGAALTTYMSLAGRYCVLMPNTPRGGGISRKIANSGDRKHLKAIMSDLEVPKGMGVIVRTAGAKRTKEEITHDYEYLARLWDTIRDTTMNSVAPALIHQEGDLVKRSLRDLYNKDIEEVLVQGETAYNEAHNFINMLMPSHAKNVKHYQDDIPLFLRYQVDKQIEASLDPVAQLPSGGYLVIHPTEALVSVDVNSGRSTKERNVERTALKTNLEAAEEVARQMRLRDLAGLVVIDFIDMDENRNNRAVEKRMKDALARDRARVQMGRISQFGLMEISRQRRRRSLLEASSASCEHCGGVGRKRSVESSALLAIRAVEEEGVRGLAKRIRLRVSPNVALYLFNEKRDLLTHVDEEFDVFTELVSDDSLHRPAFEIERTEMREDAGKDKLEPIERAAKAEMKKRPARPARQQQDSRDDSADDEASKDESGESGGNSRRRNRGGKNRRGKNDNQSGGRNSGNRNKNNDESPDKSDDTSVESKDTENRTPDNDGENGEPRKRRRRRGRRGGRTKRSGEGGSDENQAASDSSENASKSEGQTDAGNQADKGDAPKSARKRRSRNAKSGDKAEVSEAKADAEKPAEEAKPKRTRARKPAPKKDAAPADNADQDKPAAPKRTRRKAPAKPAEKAAEDAQVKPEAKTPAEKPKRVRRAAPKAPAKTEPAAEKPKARAKAAAKPKPAPKAEPKAEAKPAQNPQAEAKPQAAPKAKAEKKTEKKGWWSKRNPFSN